MSVAMTNEFLEALRKSGLLEDSPLERELATYSGSDDPQKMAEYFVQQKFLTNFQARSLLAGRYKGLVIGPYRILDKIGQGGMGIVYLAEHAKLQRRVAIKILPEDKTKDKLALERFYREARAAAALDHPNIVKAHDVCENNGVHFLVMEFIDGVNLQKYVDSKGPLPWKTALNIVIQTCRGLQHAHERNMVHRDIKPANILVDKSGQVKILDLGLARSFEQKKDNLTQDLSDGKDVMGSIDYISPEQAIGSQKIDIRADIYSLGATLYTLVTGKPPVEGTTAQKLLQHQLKLPAPLHKLNSDVPEDVSKAVLKMLAKKPDQRYATPADVITGLTPYVMSNSQRIPQIGNTQLNSGPIRGGNEVQLDTLPVANLLTDDLQTRTPTGPLAPIPARTTNIMGGKNKPFKKKRKKSSKQYGNVVWIMAGTAITIFALAGTVWLFMSLGNNQSTLPVSTSDSYPGGSTRLGRNRPSAISPSTKPLETTRGASSIDTSPPDTALKDTPPAVTDQGTATAGGGAERPSPFNNTKIGANNPNPSFVRNSGPYTGVALILGQSTPPYLGQNLTDGRLIKLPEYEGRVVLLVNWSVTNPETKLWFTQLHKIHDQMKDRPFAIVGINLDRNPSASVAEVNKLRIPWPNISRTTLRETHTPDKPASGVNAQTMYLISSEGETVKQFYNVANLPEMMRWIDAETKKAEANPR